MSGTVGDYEYSPAPANVRGKGKVVQIIDNPLDRNNIEILVTAGVFTRSVCRFIRDGKIVHTNVLGIYEGRISKFRDGDIARFRLKVDTSFTPAVGDIVETFASSTVSNKELKDINF